LIVFASSSYATHNRAGFITVKSIPGSYCLCDSIIITTYTKTSSLADRPTLPVDWGDNTSDSAVQRAYKLNLDTQLYPDVSINVYYTTHCFPGPGTYTITMEDPNRNQGVNNIPNSVNIPFFLSTTITLDSALGCYSSPVILNQPIVVGCVGQPYIYNPNAYSPNGDSLSYSLIPCRGASGANIIDFTEPHGTSNFTLNPITGDLMWDNPRYSNSNPVDLGEWNVAILISSWRKDQQGNYLYLGNVTLDMQITIDTCHVIPPTIGLLAQDTCVVAGSNIRIHVVATDPDGDVITLTATGGPFEVSNPATFPQGVSGASNVTANLNWLTDCNNIRRLPYPVTFTAMDNDPHPNPVNLTDMTTINISVISPAPKNLIDSVHGNTIYPHWNPEICPNALGYRIYRKQGFYSDSIQCPCTVGVPSSTGFVLIAEITGINDTIYADDNNGLGLNHGVKYCYFVTAFYNDSSESCASNQACAQLTKDSPIITNVSIDTTDVTNGRIYVAWSKPTQLDTINSYFGPYKYKIYRSNGFIGAQLRLVDSTNSSPGLSFADTTYYDSLLPPINTLDSAWSYRIDLYSDDTLVNSSSLSSSVYLSIAGADHTLNLSWSEQVGWTDTLYKIYRFDTVAHAWDSIGTSVTNSYADNNLPYHVKQTYFVQSVGYYTGNGYVYPILNNSEIMSAIPIDNIPPCSPDSTVVNADCIAHEDFLTWNNPNLSCSNYVAGYNIYYSPTNKDDYELIATITGSANTSYLFKDTTSIAGCFKITSVDSAGLESKNAIQVCVDNCPEYSLPNVFTPNGDGFNDFFHPFPYSYIKDIEIEIYDRWGVLMFKTTNPDINWDGKNSSTKGNCSDGVYYYICKVNSIHFDGIRTTTLKGFIELIRK